jgi:hypothetical protein
VLSKYQIQLNGEVIEYLLSNISLKDYYSGDLNLKNSPFVNEDEIDKSEPLQNEIRQLISEI